MQPDLFSSAYDRDKTNLLQRIWSRLATLRQLKLAWVRSALALGRSVEVSAESRQRLRHALHRRPHLRRPGPLPSLPAPRLLTRCVALERKLLRAILTPATASSTMELPPQPHGAAMYPHAHIRSLDGPMPQAAALRAVQARPGRLEAALPPARRPDRSQP